MQPTKVAWVTCVVASYRIPFLRRLGGEEGLELVVYYGQEKGDGPIASPGDFVPVKGVPVRNLFWPTPSGHVAKQNMARPTRRL